MSHARQSVTFLPVVAVLPHPGNVRDDLGDVTEMAASVRQHGILQPLVVTEHPDIPKRFLLLAGHRRLAAAKRAGMERVPCIVRHDLGAEASEQVALMLVENGHRRQLTPLETARGMQRLIDMGLNQSEVARLTGRAVSSINTYLLMLEADDDTIDRLESGEVTATEVREAVKAARAKKRTDCGKPTRGRPIVVEAGYFTVHHRLDATVKAECTHTTRPFVGSIGCGQCWEGVILRDAGVGGFDQ